ncbi:MAG TPA: helix-turn-helix domain-containing protein [Ktedonobacteraceae bacterium]|nr:helix-turn-helix domain-containing protein [Ktedonobacteraceae bacterium]
MFSFSSLPQNPFSETEFWGRQREIIAVSRYLLSEEPRCCAIIGEDTFGKTRLLQYLSQAQKKDDSDYPQLNTLMAQLREQFVFVFLNCAGYGDDVADKKQDLASARFWWDLYDATRKKLQGDLSPRLAKPKAHMDEEYIDTALEIRWELEDLIQNYAKKVVFVLDNFEGVAKLPLRDSEWLRSIARDCTYVVASRDLLYLLYHSSNWEKPSPLWNLFGDPIYLNLPAVEDVDRYLSKACETARLAHSAWQSSDIEYIKKSAGRHPALLRVACASMFEYRLQAIRIVGGKLSYNDKTYLDDSIDSAAGPICMKLWHGLARAELREEYKGSSNQQEAARPLSLHQRALLEIAKETTSTKEALLLADVAASEKQKIVRYLQQRDLIEYKGAWHLFSEAMQRFVVKQELALPVNTIPAQGFPDWQDGQREMPGLTHQEKKVYDYLKIRRGELCSREDIKQAIWPNTEPTNSALQKIIERIREKIEPDVDNPRYLIAVRGKGYILRED